WPSGRRPSSRTSPAPRSAARSACPSRSGPPRPREGGEGDDPLAAGREKDQLDRDPCPVHPEHALAGRGRRELNQPQPEEARRLVSLEAHRREEDPPEKGLQDRQEDLQPLELVERERRGVAV